MITAGKITIDLGEQIRIRSNRTTAVSSLLVGRKVDEVLDLLPRIYSLCAEAHVFAARLAMGLETRASDHLAVLAENAREHILRIMLGWKVDNAEQMPILPVMSLITAMREASGTDRNKVIDMLDVYLSDHVFGCPPAEFLSLETVSDLSNWMTENRSPASLYLNKICDAGWQGLGATNPAFLPELTSVQLLERICDDGFCLQPEWMGTPCETSPLARQYSVLLVQEMRREYGAGLFVRLVARLIDLAKIPSQMRMLAPVATNQNGVGVVETARGRLIHTAKVQDGLIRDYKILAPTEWNFHPAGVAAHALRGLQPAEARAVVEAIDPCVEFELRSA